jgi:hypothetical protein
MRIMGSANERCPSGTGYGSERALPDRIRLLADTSNGSARSAQARSPRRLTPANPSATKRSAKTLVCSPAPGEASLGCPCRSVTNAVEPSGRSAPDWTNSAVDVAKEENRSASTSSRPARAARATRPVSHAHRPCDQVYLSVERSVVPALSQQVSTPPYSSSGPCVDHHASTSSTRWHAQSLPRPCALSGMLWLLVCRRDVDQLGAVLAEGVDQRVGLRVRPRSQPTHDDEHHQ